MMWISLRVSIDHGELSLRYAGAVNWHKILQVCQKWDGSWTVKQSFEMTNGLNQHDFAMKQLMSRRYEWAVNRFSIKVWTSKFYHCLWNWWNYSFCLSLLHESLYQQHKNSITLYSIIHKTVSQHQKLHHSLNYFLLCSHKRLMIAVSYNLWSCADHRCWLVGWRAVLIKWQMSGEGIPTRWH